LTGKIWFRVPGSRFKALILLKNPPFILREPQDERWSSEIIGNFPFMLSLVEAFLGFSAESIYKT
jgi:hypothetical protein